MNTARLGGVLFSYRLCRLDQVYNDAVMSNWAYGAAIIYASESHDFIELHNIP